MIRIRITRGRRVDCRAVVRTPLPKNKVWGQIRDFHTYARLEFFHADIDISGGLPRAGAVLEIRHRFFLFRVRRVGRICRWKEGEGFAFSDLSSDGAKTGFPHIFSYRLLPNSPTGCNVEIRVAGKWTAKIVPRWMIWLWLRWIMQFAVQQVENQLLIYQIWLTRRNPAAKSSATKFGCDRSFIGLK